MFDTSKITEEADTIRTILDNHLPQHWDGKESVLALKEVNYNWKQMEWIGWYLEYFGREALFKHYGGSEGPRYGNTALDYKNICVWDFKAHPVNSSSHPWAIMNDCEAINRCIEEYGGIGFIIALGDAVYNDAQRTFKQWHQQLKGGLSDYERERIARSAPSRRRKQAFHLHEYRTVYISGRDQLDDAVDKGWLSGDAQTGWRNADGSPRRSKYKINVDAVSDWARV